MCQLSGSLPDGQCLHYHNIDVISLSIKRHPSVWMDHCTRHDLKGITQIMLSAVWKLLATNTAGININLYLKQQVKKRFSALIRNFILLLDAE